MGYIGKKPAQVDVSLDSNSITAVEMAGNSVLASEIAANAIGSSELANNSIQALHVPNATALTLDGGLTIDNITIDGTEIDLSSGDLTVDVAGDIILDADGGDITFKDGGTSIASFKNSSGTFIIKSESSDADIYFNGNDGGSAITAMAIDMSEGGRVGIGTTSPVYGLDVRNTIYSSVAATTKNLTLGDSTNGTTSAISTNNNDLIFYHNGSTESMRIDSTGVGIGTTSPTEALSISSSDGLVSATSTASKTTGVLTGGFVIYSGDGSGPGDGNRAGIQSYAKNSVGSQYDLRFYTSDGTTNLNEVARFEDGNLGVGTTSPGTILEVDSGTAGTSDAEAGITVKGQRSGVVYNLISSNSIPNANTGTGILFQSNGFNQAAIISRLATGTASSGDCPGYLTFHTAADGTETLSERIRIDSSGRVGIGTDDPSDNLEVASALGTIRITDTDGGYARLRSNGGNLILQADEGATIADSSIQFHIDGDEHARIDSNSRMIIGHTASIDNGSHPRLQVYHSGSAAHVAIGRWGDSSSPPHFTFVKSRNSTVGSNTIVQDGDNLGKIRWRPADGNDFQSEAASIYARVDGTPGQDDMPGELYFATTNDGGSTALTRMVIKANGNVGIGTDSPSDLLHLESSSGDVRQLMNAPTNSDAEIKFAENGTVKYTIGHDAASDNFVIGTTNVDTEQRLVINSSGNVGIGSTSPSHNLNVTGSNGVYIQKNTTSSAQTTILTLKNQNSQDQTDAMTLDIDFHLWDNNTQNAVPQGRIGLIGDATGSQDDESGGRLAFYVATDSLSNPVITKRGMFVAENGGDFYTNDGTVSSISDVRVKKDITSLSDGLSIVNQLRPVTFKYNNDSSHSDVGDIGDADDILRYGFVADEVKTVAPQYVKEGKGVVNGNPVTDFKSLSMMRMIPMLVKALQEADNKIDALEARIAILEE